MKNKVDGHGCGRFWKTIFKVFWIDGVAKIRFLWLSMDEGKVSKWRKLRKMVKDGEWKNRGIRLWHFWKKVNNVFGLKWWEFFGRNGVCTYEFSDLEYAWNSIKNALKNDFRTMLQSLCENSHWLCAWCEILTESLLFVLAPLFSFVSLLCEFFKLSSCMNTSKLILKQVKTNLQLGIKTKTCII